MPSGRAASHVTAEVSDASSENRADRRAPWGMGCSSSKETAGPPPLPPQGHVPSQQRQTETVASHLESLGLGKYAAAFEEIGFDDMEHLRELAQDELLEIAKRVNMLEGHASKWIRSLTGAPVQLSKVQLVLSGGDNGDRSQPMVAAATNVTAATDVMTVNNDSERAMFFFIKAEKLRGCDDVVLPKFQDLRRQRPDWFVEKEITLEGACKHEYVGKVLGVSHRWEKEADPDTAGKQLAAIKKYLTEHKALELVWLDYYCAPQRIRTPDEEVVFQRTLRFISHLFLGSSILILCDRTYTTRFWTLFEAWLSMQMTSPDGLVPAPKDKRRCDIVPIHLASDLTAKELVDMMGNKTVDEAYAILDSPDINVTNQKDKGQQLAKLLALDAQVSQAMQPIAPPTLLERVPSIKLAMQWAAVLPPPLRHVLASSSMRGSNAW